MRTSVVRCVVWGVLCSGGVLAVAGDNVLGLPRPVDPQQPGALVLHGGGRITEDVFDRFVELAGGRQARILLVPSAGYRPTDYDSEDEFRDAMRTRFSAWVGLERNGRVRSFDFLYTDDPADADDADFVRPLERATGVWFCGGTQRRLNYRYVGYFPEPTRFQVALRRVVERGGVVGGTSAGMAALPEVITLWDDSEYDGGPANAIAAHGLGLLTGAIVEQHFDGRAGRLERFTGLLRNAAQLDQLAGRRGEGAQMLGLAVEERAGLIVEGDRLQVLGGGNAHVFIKSQSGRTVTWHELQPGDTAQLRRDVPGRPQLAREETLLSSR